jgi:hypothetical protein
MAGRRASAPGQMAVRRAYPVAGREGFLPSIGSTEPGSPDPPHGGGPSRPHNRPGRCPQLSLRWGWDSRATIRAKSPCWDAFRSCRRALPTVITPYPSRVRYR